MKQKQKGEQIWKLLENGKVIKTNLSHTRAKNLKWLKQKEADDDWLDLLYYEHLLCNIKKEI